MVGVDDVDGELLGPGMAVEAGAEHVAVLGPRVAGVGGGVDAEEAQRPVRQACVPATFCAGDHGVSPMLNRARTRAAASRSGETSPTSVTTVGERPDMLASS